MPAIAFDTVSKLPSMRKLSFGAWQAPNNPSIFYEMTLPSSGIQAYAKANGGHDATPYRHSIAHALAATLRDCPEMNRFVLRGKMRQRRDVKIMLSKLLRDKKDFDLTGIDVLNPDQLGLSDLSTLLQHKSKVLRAGKDSQVRRFQNLLRFIPLRFMPRLVQFAEWLMYRLNIDLQRLGLPGDRFGSAIVSDLGAFGVDSAYIPLFPFSRCSIMLSIGTARTIPWVNANGNVVAEECLSLKFTFDHRLMDGVHGARFVKRLQDLLT